MKTIDVTLQRSNRDFTATFGDGVTGVLKYPKWYSFMAMITVGESVYRIFPTGFWKFRYEVIKDGKVVLTVKNTWNGYLITKSTDLERPLTITPKGSFKSGYVIKNHKQEVLLEVDSNFRWEKFQQDYKVNCNDVFGNDEIDRVLVLLSVYFYITSQTAAVGA